MRYILLIWAALIGFSAQAQFGDCVDSTLADPFFQCSRPEFRPVCGCDGNTYRNECVALNNFGVLFYTSGVCSNFDFDFYPNPSFNNQFINFSLEFREFTLGSIDVKIIDMFGKVKFQRIANNINRLDLQIDVSGLRPGVYNIVAVSGEGFGLVKRFVRT